MKIRPIHYFMTTVFCLVILVNAASPFIGLKWEFSFNMFSGLKTDGSNHYLLPSYHLFDNYEYWIVNELEIQTLEYDEHAVMLCELLTATGQPAMASSSPEEDQRSLRPIHGNVIRYHLSKFQENGIDVHMSLESIDGLTLVDLSSRDAPSQWTSFSYHIQYPVVMHNYSIIHRIRERYHERARDQK